MDGIDVFFDDSECDADALYICLVNVISLKFADNFQCGLDFESYPSSVSCVYAYMLMYTVIHVNTCPLSLFN